MPIFRVRLEDRESGEFRSVAAAADSEAEAVASVESKELKHVNFLLDASEVADFEKRLRKGELTARDKARLFSHRQERPYKVMKAEKS